MVNDVEQPLNISPVRHDSHVLLRLLFREKTGKALELEKVGSVSSVLIFSRKDMR